METDKPHYSLPFCCDLPTIFDDDIDDVGLLIWMLLWQPRRNLHLPLLLPSFFSSNLAAGTGFGFLFFLFFFFRMVKLVGYTPGLDAPPSKLKKQTNKQKGNISGGGGDSNEGLLRSGDRTPGGGGE